VLSPVSPLTPYLLGVVFALLLAFMVVNAVRKDRREYRRFKRMRSTSRRQKVFRKWLRQLFLAFGGSAAVVLALAWQFIAPFQDAVDEWGFVRDARLSFADSGWVGPTIATVVVVIVVGVLVGGIVLARTEPEVPALGDVQALLPRNRAELRYGAGLAINAGIVEELLFRLALPALIYGFSGSAVAAVVVSIVIFGLLHVYQGVAGIVGATVLGAVFMAMYLGTGNILVPIVVHALFDLRSLVLIPMVVFQVHLDAADRRPRPVEAAPPGEPVETPGGLDKLDPL
jgi:membrane protease YdiL (CAAX protease family)